MTLVGWRRAAAWLVLLGIVFYGSYGAANAWAASRAGVPSVVFGWEHQLPFWAWTIFPYWSVNALYALSLFVARNRREMDRHAARLLTAQAIAIACFVLWPLRFSFGQPEVAGAPAFLFDALRSFDQPYNQAPSLHVALVVILWDWYQRLLRAWWARLIAHVWALAIALSVLTTWQHHALDVPTGALLGLWCVWLWPLRRPQGWRWSQEPARRRLAAGYAMGALAATWAWSQALAWLPLLWLAAALAAVALSYAGLGARGLGMDAQGRLTWAARWLLAPHRLGAAFNAWAWTRGQPPAQQVQGPVWLGRRPTWAEWQRAGRPQVLTLAAELPLDARIPVRALPQLDLVPATPAQLRRAAWAIERLAAQGSPVWVCCALGASRSAAAVAAWLTYTQGLSAEQAVAAVRAARPSIVLGGAWQSRLEQTWTS